MNISYEVSDQLSPFVEGINLTDQRVHGRSTYQLREYAGSCPLQLRYALLIQAETSERLKIKAKGRWSLQDQRIFVE